MSNVKRYTKDCSPLFLLMQFKLKNNKYGKTLCL